MCWLNSLSSKAWLLMVSLKKLKPTQSITSTHGLYYLLLTDTVLKTNTIASVLYGRQFSHIVFVVNPHKFNCYIYV